MLGIRLLCLPRFLEPLPIWRGASLFLLQQQQQLSGVSVKFFPFNSRFQQSAKVNKHVTPKDADSSAGKGRVGVKKNQVLIVQGSKSFCFSERIISFLTFSRGRDLFQAFQNSQVASHASLHTQSWFHLHPSCQGLVTGHMQLFVCLSIFASIGLILLFLR